MKEQAKEKPIKFNKAKSNYTAFLFIAPFIVLLFTFNILLFIWGAKMSFTDMQGINPGDFIGFANYVEIFKDEQHNFSHAVISTLIIAFGSLITQVPVAFVLAYILNNVPKKMQGFLRASFFFPVLMSSIGLALLFRMLFNKDTGIINWICGLVGLPNKIDWINNSSYTFPLILIVLFWQWMGYHMVYFLASLQSIDNSLFEVAKIDGASAPRVLFQIVMPLMRPAFTFVMVTSAIGGLQVFDIVFMLFPNNTYGPGGIARTLVGHILDQGFYQNLRLGYATSIGWITFFIILAVSLLQLRFLGLGNSGEE